MQKKVENKKKEYYGYTQPVFLVLFSKGCF